MCEYVTMLLCTWQRMWYYKTTQHWTQAYTQHFQYFPHLLTKLNNFMSLEAQIGKGLQIILKHQMQGARKKTQDKKEEDYDIFIPNVWRKNFRPSLVSNPISFSFLVNFEWYKNLWECQLEIQKNLFELQRQRNNDQKI